MTNEKKFLYAVEPFTWRKSPSGDWDEYEYPRGTKVEIIGIGPRGYNVRIVETGVEMYETGLMKWTNKPELIETNMTNEEKAREVVNEYGFWDYRDRDCSVKSAIKMAEWKDKQFEEYLKKKNAEISNAKAKLDKDDADYMLCTLKSLFIDEIIDELFPEQEQDNSNNDE